MGCFVWRGDGLGYTGGLVDHRGISVCVCMCVFSRWVSIYRDIEMGIKVVVEEVVIVEANNNQTWACTQHKGIM